MRIRDWSSDVCSSDLLPAGKIATNLDKTRADQDFIARQQRPVTGDPASVDHGAAQCSEVIDEWTVSLLFDARMHLAHPPRGNVRSEERRVGKECVSQCSTGGSRV